MSGAIPGAAEEGGRRAVVLFGHGARNPEWALPMRRTAALLEAGTQGLRVELAFLELMSPTLDVVLEKLAGEGFAIVHVIPMFLAQGGHLKRDLPALVEAAQARHPGCRIALAGAVGEAEEVIAAMAAYALRIAAPPTP